MPDFPVHHKHLELAQTHVHRVGDTIQPFHPLSSHSPPAFNLSQHQGLFQWVSSSHQVQSIGVSTSVSVLSKNSQNWFPLGLTGMILLSERFSAILSNTTVQKHQFFNTHLSLWSNSQIHTRLLVKAYLWLDGHLLVKKCLLFNMLSRFVIAFLPRSKWLLISWLQSPSAVILEPKKIKYVTVSIVSQLFAMKNGTRCHDLHFLKAEF